MVEMLRDKRLSMTRFSFHLHFDYLLQRIFLKESFHSEAEKYFTRKCNLALSDKCSPRSAIKALSAR